MAWAKKEGVIPDESEVWEMSFRINLDTPFYEVINQAMRHGGLIFGELSESVLANTPPVVFICLTDQKAHELRDRLRDVLDLPNERKDSDLIILPHGNL